MPIQLITKLNTGAIMPRIGLGTFYPAHALRVAPPADQVPFPPLEPFRYMEIESWGGRGRRRDCTQEWLQTHRYGFRLWLVR